VVNFDVPHVADDYIHRVGRTARADATGAAFTLVAPEEEEDLRGIERAINQRLPRVTLPDFDYAARPEAPPRPQGGPRGGHPVHHRGSGRGGHGSPPSHDPRRRRPQGGRGPSRGRDRRGSS
jgi:ATP-dependent RNA helicase RhlE